MNLKSPLPNYFVGKRRSAPTTLASGLALPENMLGGNSEATTEYRLVDLLSVPDAEEDFKVGDTVLIHELDKTPFNIDPTDRNIQVIPKNKIRGVQDEKGKLLPVEDNVFGSIIEEEERIGLIIVPEMVQQEKLNQKIRVFACGPECSGDIKIGDTLLVRKGIGCGFNFRSKCLAIREKETIPINGEEVEIMAILGVLEIV